MSLCEWCLARIRDPLKSALIAIDPEPDFALHIYCDLDCASAAARFRLNAIDELFEGIRVASV